MSRYYLCLDLKWRENHLRELAWIVALAPLELKSKSRHVRYLVRQRLQETDFPAPSSIRMMLELLKDMRECHLFDEPHSFFAVGYGIKHDLWKLHNLSKAKKWFTAEEQKDFDSLLASVFDLQDLEPYRSFKELADTRRVTVNLTPDGTSEYVVSKLLAYLYADCADRVPLPGRSYECDYRDVKMIDHDGDHDGDHDYDDDHEQKTRNRKRPRKEEERDSSKRNHSNERHRSNRSRGRGRRKDGHGKDGHGQDGRGKDAKRHRSYQKQDRRRRVKQWSSTKDKRLSIKTQQNDTAPVINPRNMDWKTFTREHPQASADLLQILICERN